MIGSRGAPPQLDTPRALLSKLTPLGTTLPRRHRQRRPAVSTEAVSSWVASAADGILSHLYLAYEHVALPCSTVMCGDMIYRSTLDPNLRMEEHGVSPMGVALIAACVFYLFATPGVLPGIIDYYLTAVLQRQGAKVYNKDNLVLGKKLGGGGFGMVYKADLHKEDGEVVDAVVKKAKEFGEAEVWMNERLMRLPRPCCAEFITAFEEDSGVSRFWGGGKTNLMYSGDTKGQDYHTADPPLWLVWKYEGDYTLCDLLQHNDFPYNLEPYLFKQDLSIPKGPHRKLVIIKRAMHQILEALDQCHSVGIVHRDVKPQNCIISEREGRIKFIDLGAAADLRVGINYVPNEFLLDPRYAPPQNYIMSTQTPRAPAAPMAALLSPILWQMEKPDRFDMYSAGMIMLQMVFPKLRSDNNLIAFNRKFESLNYNLEKWRDVVEKSSGREFKEGFQILDLEDGAGWDFLKKLLVFDQSKRPSAGQALRSRMFVGGPNLAFMEFFGKNLGDVTAPVLKELNVEDAVERAQRMEGFTENQLAEELGERRTPIPTREASYTIAWWKTRQASLEKRLKVKSVRAVKAVSKSVSEAKESVERKVSEAGFFTTLGLSRRSST